MTNIVHYGWTTHFENYFSKFSSAGYSPGRVIVQNKTNYIVAVEIGELTAELTGKFYFDHDFKNEYPVVGDWVALRILHAENKGFIDHVLPRKTRISRNSAGIKTEEQIIAANVDTAFIMTSMNHDINIRRLERYMMVCAEVGIEAVIILTKSDLCENPDAIYNIVRAENFPAPINLISAVNNIGLQPLEKYFQKNKTIALLGSSGVGKSTLINKLCPDADIDVKDISAYKDKGRHTTTKREMFVLPGGGLIIDNPGLRELQLWDGSGGAGILLADIEDYAGKCRFSDCSHNSEPGCAIREAIESGLIDTQRYNSYVKLAKEIAYMERKQDIKASLLEKRRWKKLTSEVRNRGRI